MARTEPKLGREDARMRRFFHVRVAQAQAVLQALTDAESEWLQAMREKYGAGDDAQLDDATDEFVAGQGGAS